MADEEQVQELDLSAFDNHVKPKQTGIDLSAFDTIQKKNQVGNVSVSGGVNTPQLPLKYTSDQNGSIPLFNETKVFKDIGKEIPPELQQRHDEILARQKELNNRSKTPSYLQRYDDVAAPILGFNRDLVQSVNPKKVAEIDHDVNGHWGNIVQNVFAKIEKTGTDIAAGTLSLINDAEQLQNPVKMQGTPMDELIAGLNGNKQRMQSVIDNNQLPNTFLGNTVSSLASIAPDIAGSMLAPEAKVAQGASVLAKAGGLLFNKFTNYLIGKGAVVNYGEAKEQGQTPGQVTIQALKGGAEGAKQGIELALLGGGSGLATKSIMAKAEQAGLTGAKAMATRQLVNLSTDLVAYGLVQPTVNAAEEGRFPTMKEIADGAGIAAAFRIKGGAEELKSHSKLNKAIEETQNQRQGVAIANFVDADHNAIKQIYDQPETAQELNLKALEAAKKAKETTDLSKKQEYVAQAITYTKASNVKSVADMVLNNQQGLEDFKNSPDIPDQVKQQFLQKAKEVSDIIKPKEQINNELQIENKNIVPRATLEVPQQGTPEQITKPIELSVEPQTLMDQDAKANKIQQQSEDQQPKVEEVNQVERSTEKVSFEKFKADQLDHIANVKDSKFDWRIQMDLSQPEREKGVQDIKDGKDTAASKKVNAAIQDMYDKGVVPMNRGRGTQVESRDFGFHELGLMQEHVPGVEKHIADYLRSEAELTPEDHQFATDNIDDIIHHYESEHNTNTATTTGQDKQSTPGSKEESSSQVIPNDSGESGNQPPIDPTSTNTDAGSGDAGIGVHHNALTDLAKKLGLGEPERGVYWTPEEYANRGRQLLNSGADPEEALNGNNKLHDRISIARAHIEDFKSIADAMAKKWGVNSEQYKKAKAELSSYAESTKALGTEAHRAMVSLQGVRDLDTGSFVSVQQKVEEQTGKPTTPEQKKKITELTTHTDKVSKEAKEAEKKLVQATDENIGKKESEKTFKERAKLVADKFRKLKSKPFTFKDENGNDIPIQIQGVSWNDLVEIGAKAIEKTGEIADGVAAIIDNIKDSDFYKGLSQAKREDLAKQLTDHYENQVKDTPEAKNIKRLEKELENLQNGIAKQKSVKRELSDTEKDLQEQIFEAKKQLGLVPSKGVPEKPKATLSAEEKRVKHLEKQLDDLREGKIKEQKEKVELTQREKDLKEEIFNEKQKLGLIKSKAEKPLTEEEKAQENISKREDLAKQFINKTDSKFTPEEAKAIWEYAKSEYIEKGVPYRDMVSYLSDDLGLSWKQISDAITSPKTKAISDEMYKKQAELRRVQLKVKDYVETTNRSWGMKILKGTSDAFRSAAVFAHGHIFVGTHAGMTLFDLPRAKYTVKAFLNGVKFAYGNEANYERNMDILRNRDNFTIAQRAGLQNDPNESKMDDYQNSSQGLGKWIGKLGLTGVKGFNAIKVLRQDLFDAHYSKLSPAQKADANSAKSIAELVNNATGATNLNVPKALQEVAFAANMEVARWEKLTSNPIKATSTALKALVTPDKATDQEKVFAKVWASRVGWEIATYAGLLTTNAAIQGLLNPKNPVNLTRPKDPDFMKFKIGNTDIDPTSGMRGAMQFVRGLTQVATEKQKDLHGDTRLEAFGKNAIGYGRGKLSPFAGTVVDAASHTDFAGNVLPFYNDKPRAGKHKLGYGEYAWSKAPIPVADAAKTIYDGMIENGMTKPQAENWWAGAIAMAEAASTGFRISESHEPKGLKLSDADKASKGIKYFLDKGLDLPHTLLSSEKITDKSKMTQKKISDFPKDVQEKYETTHKELLKKELETIVNKGFVYVRTYKDGEGKPIEEVSLMPKRNSKPTKLDNLSEESLTQVLSLSQSEATKKSKLKIFGKH